MEVAETAKLKILIRVNAECNFYWVCCRRILACRSSHVCVCAEALDVAHAYWSLTARVVVSDMKRVLPFHDLRHMLLVAIIIRNIFSICASCIYCVANSVSPLFALLRPLQKPFRLESLFFAQHWSQCIFFDLGRSVFCFSFIVVPLSFFDICPKFFMFADDRRTVVIRAKTIPFVVGKS